MALENIEKSPDAQAGVYQYMFFMDSAGDDPERAIASGRRWLEFHRQWGKEPEKISDAAQALSRYMKGLGRDQEADELYQEFVGTIDEMCEGMEDLTILEDDYRRASHSEPPEHSPDPTKHHRLPSPTQSEQAQNYPTPSTTRNRSVDARSPGQSKFDDQSPSVIEEEGDEEQPAYAQDGYVYNHGHGYEVKSEQPY